MKQREIVSGKYGEPFKYHPGSNHIGVLRISDRDGNWMTKVQAQRAFVLLNALTGIEDPERFVREAKALRVIAKDSVVIQHVLAALRATDDDELARLAAEWEERKHG